MTTVRPARPEAGTATGGEGRGMAGFGAGLDGRLDGELALGMGVGPGVGPGLGARGGAVAAGRWGSDSGRKPQGAGEPGRSPRRRPSARAARSRHGADPTSL